MKKGLICKLIKCLYRVLPLPAWQAFLMDKHLTVCPHCRIEAAKDDQVKQLLVSPKQAKILPDIWPHVHNQIENSGNSQSKETIPKWKRGIPVLPGWPWKAAAVGLFILLVIVFYPSSVKKEQSTLEIHQTENDVENKVMVKSVKIGSKEAKYYFFKSKDPDKIIIWAERNQLKGE